MTQQPQTPGHKARIPKFLEWMLRYGLAAAAVAAAMGLRLALEAWVGSGLPAYITFYPAVMAAALLAGFGPGLAATALAGLASGYWILPPVGEFSIASPADRMGLVIFICMGLFMSAVAELYRRSRAKAEAYDRQAALRESQARTAAILEGIADTFYSLDEAWRFTLVNPAAERAPFGRPAAELLGRVLWDLYPGLVGSPIQQHYFDAAQHHSLEHYESQSPLNGRWYEVFMQGWRGGVDVYMRDVTGRKQAEEDREILLAELSLEKTRWQATVDTMPDLVTVCDAGGKVTYINPAYTRLIERPQAEGLAVEDHPGYYQLYRPDGSRFAAGDLPLQKAALEGLEVQNVEIVHRRADGGEFTGIFSAAPLRDGAGNIYGAVAVGRDVTEQRAVERALKESEERFRRMFEDHHAVMLAIEPGTGAIMDANTAAVRFYGYTRRQLCAMYIQEINQLSPEAVAAERRNAAIELRNYFVFPHRLAGGEMRWVEVYSTPVQTAGKKLLFSIIHDITGRKLAEEALHRTHELLEAVTAEAEVAIAARDRDLRYTYFNTAHARELARITGREPRLGMSLEEEFEGKPDLFRVAKEAWDRTLAGERRRYETAFGDPDRPKDYAMFHTPLRDAGGRVVGAGVMGWDITARKRMEEALRFSEQKFSRAFANNPAAIALSRLEDGIFLDVNETWSALNGYSRDEIIGKSARELPIWPAPEAAARFVHALREKGAVRGMEQEFHKKSGEVFVAEISAQLLTFQGEQVILSALVDITARKRAEEAVRQSEERFRQLADAMPQLVWTGNADGIIDYYNARSVEYGVAVASLTADDWTPALHPDDMAPSLEAWREAVARGLTYQKEQRLRAADGSYRWHLARAIPQRDQNGVIVKWFGTTTDIHDLKQVEEALRESEARFRLALRNAPVSVAAQDRDLRYIWAFNQRSARPEQIIGHRDEDLFTAAEAARFTAAKRRVLEEGVELRDQLWLERSIGPMYLDICWEPIRDDAGRVVGVASATVDQTATKLAEKALRESEERFRVIASSTPDHLLVQDRDLKYTFVINPQLGLTVEDMIGRTDHDFLKKEDADQLAEIKRRVLDTGDPVHLETPLQSADDGLQYFSGTYVPKHDAGGCIDGLIGYFRNITENKRAEEALRESENKFSTAFHMSPLAMSLSSADDNAYRDVNSTFLRDTGYTREEVIGRTSGDLGIFAVPQDRERLVDLVRRTGHIYGAPCTFRIKSGALLECLVSITVIASADQHLLLSIIQDITPLARAQEALRESEQRFKAISETTPVGIGVIGLPEGEFLYVNPAYAKAFGYAEDEMLGRGVQPIYWDLEDRNRILDVLKEKGFVADYEVRLKRRDGTLFWGYASVRPITYDGRPALLGAFVDITDRKKAEEQIARNSEELNLKNRELEVFNRAMVDRELRMIQLKNQINELCEQAGRPRPYPLEFKKP